MSGFFAWRAFVRPGAWWGETPPYGTGRVFRGLRAGLLALCLALLAAPLWAVQPDEMLADPAQEARARELSKGLRCLVCQNESIDDSNASLARDLRLLVRERIVAGDSDEEVIDFIVERYGEFVLLQPTTGGANWLLWAAGPLMLLAALGMGAVYVRRRSQARTPDEQRLSAEESARLQEILGRRDP